MRSDIVIYNFECGVCTESNKVVLTATGTRLIYCPCFD